MLAPHLQNDIDAILDCYRNCIRRDHLDEAIKVWELLHSAKIFEYRNSDIQRKSQMIASLYIQSDDIKYQQKVKDYLLPDTYYTTDTTFSLHLVIPQYIYGNCPEFPKRIRTLDQYKHLHAILTKRENRKHLYGFGVEQKQNPTNEITIFPKDISVVNYNKEEIPHVYCNTFLDYCSPELARIIDPFIEDGNPQKSYFYRGKYYAPTFRRVCFWRHDRILRFIYDNSTKAELAAEQEKTAKIEKILDSAKMFKKDESTLR